MSPIHRAPWQERFIEVDRGYSSPCSEWTGATQRGYGVTRYDGRYWRVHRLVWTLAHGDPGVLLVCHHCDNRRCARLDHLFLGDNAANMQDASRKGRTRNGQLRGSQHGRARLTDAQVRDIRTDDRTLVSIAAEYGVDHTTISQIKLRKTWRHL